MMKRMYGLYEVRCGLQFTGVVTNTKKEMLQYIYKKYVNTRDCKERLANSYARNKDRKKYSSKFDYMMKECFKYTLRIKEIKRAEY